jgi:GTP-binding protein HflX
VDDEELAAKIEGLRALAPNPVAVSGLTGENVEELAARVEAELPEWHRERLVLPMSDDAMSLVSWLYDHGHVENEEYDGENVLVEFEARPAIVEKARSKAAEVQAEATGDAEAEAEADGGYRS